MVYRLTKNHYKKAAENGISNKQLYSRLYHGWDIERAITTPVHVPGTIKQKHVYYLRERSL